MGIIRANAKSAANTFYGRMPGISFIVMVLIRKTIKNVPAG